MDSLVNSGTMYAHNFLTKVSTQLNSKEMNSGWQSQDQLNREMNQGCQAQDQLSANEPTVPCLKAHNVNLWTCWVISESNPGPFAPAASGLTTELPRPPTTSVAPYRAKEAAAWSK